MSHIEKPRWTSSYRQETDYTWRGKRYAIRWAAFDPSYYNGNYYYEGIEPLVGCLYNRTLGEWHDYPPAELLAIFHEEHPQLVAARWLPDFAGVEYQGEKPATCKDVWGYVWPIWLADRRASDSFYGVTREQCGLPSLEVANV